MYCNCHKTQKGIGDGESRQETMRRMLLFVEIDVNSTGAFDSHDAGLGLWPVGSGQLLFGGRPQSLPLRAPVFGRAGVFQSQLRKPALPGDAPPNTNRSPPQHFGLRRHPVTCQLLQRARIRPPASRSFCFSDHSRGGGITAREERPPGSAGVPPAQTPPGSAGVSPAQRPPGSAGVSPAQTPARWKRSP